MKDLKAEMDRIGRQMVACENKCAGISCDRLHVGYHGNLADSQSSQQGYFPTVTMPLGPTPPVSTVGLAMSDSAPVVWSIVYWAMAERAEPVSPLVT